MIRLPVSIGEALDKLTILDIKVEKIQDPKKRDYCRQEYDLLYEELQPYIERNTFYYKLLRDVNLDIWNMQDTIRENPDPQKCVDILNKNDMRFRIKDVINRSLQSMIREQKGYPVKRALVVHHLGLGDHVGMVGAVRYIALQYDETHVMSKPTNFENVRSLFADNPTITVVCEPNSDSSYYSNIYRSGCYCPSPHPYTDLPSCFYRDMGMNPQIRHTHFHVPITADAVEMHNTLEGRPYRFVQQTSSSHTTSLVAWNIDDVLTVDPNTNLYPKDHVWHSIAESCVNRPFLAYTKVLMHAEEIHTVESSFYCLACYIPLDAKVKRCYARETGAFIPTYTFN